MAVQKEFPYPALYISVISQFKALQYGPLLCSIPYKVWSTVWQTVTGFYTFTLSYWNLLRPYASVSWPIPSMCWGEDFGTGHDILLKVFAAWKSSGNSVCRSVTNGSCNWDVPSTTESEKPFRIGRTKALADSLPVARICHQVFNG
jgi:hypothetical protein